MALARVKLLRVVLLMMMRVYLYASAGWQYFLIDFCYFANASCLAQVAFYPASVQAFRANFLLVTGPLAMAVPTWRNLIPPRWSPPMDPPTDPP